MPYTIEMNLGTTGVDFTVGAREDVDAIAAQLRDPNGIVHIGNTTQGGPEMFVPSRAVLAVTFTKVG